MRGYPADSSARWPARRVQSSIIAQADTLDSYALPTASRTRASAVDRLLRRSISLAGLIAVRRSQNEGFAAASSRMVTETIKEGVLARPKRRLVLVNPAAQ